MIAILLLALAQDAPIEERIAAFLKGDAAARAELVKLGAFAIRPLQKARGQGSDKIDALLFALKKAAAIPITAGVLDNLGHKLISTDTVDFTKDPVGVLHELTGAEVFLDRFDPADMKSTTVTLKVDRGRVHQAFDQIFEQTGLDYGVFHNVIVIGKPERLWPSGPPATPKPLTAEESARARALVERLDDPAIDVRDAATRDLLAMGRSVLALLETQSTRKESEISSRCSALARRLRRAPRGAYGPSGFERQDRTADQEGIFEAMKELRITFRVKDMMFSEARKILAEYAEVPIRLPEDWKDRAFSLSVENLSLLDIYCLIAQSVDLDFVYREGGFQFDNRDRIEELYLTR